jgi:hypothetical protein
MWKDELDAVLAQFWIKFVRVIGLVSDQTLRSFWNHHFDQVATGRPWRSATAMIFVPLPRLVFRALEPLFRSGKAAVDEGFPEVELTLNPRYPSTTALERTGSNSSLLTPRILPSQ